MISGTYRVGVLNSCDLKEENSNRYTAVSGNQVCKKGQWVTPCLPNEQNTTRTTMFERQMCKNQGWIPMQTRLRQEPFFYYINPNNIKNIFSNDKSQAARFRDLFCSDLVHAIYLDDLTYITMAYNNGLLKGLERLDDTFNTYKTFFHKFMWILCKKVEKNYKHYPSSFLKYGFGETKITESTLKILEMFLKSCKDDNDNNFLSDCRDFIQNTNLDAILRLPEDEKTICKQMIELFKQYGCIDASFSLDDYDTGVDTWTSRGGKKRPTSSKKKRYTSSKKKRPTSSKKKRLLSSFIL